MKTKVAFIHAKRMKRISASSINDRIYLHKFAPYRKKYSGNPVNKNVAKESILL